MEVRNLSNATIVCNTHIFSFYQVSTDECKLETKPGDVYGLWNGVSWYHNLHINSLHSISIQYFEAQWDSHIYDCIKEMISNRERWLDDISY